MSFRSVLAAGALAAALAAPAAAAAAPTPVALEQRPSTVASYGGILAWSHYDTAADRYRLMIQRPGQAAALAPVPDAPRPFDVALGGNRSGAPTAVYTRCTNPGAAPGAADANPRPASGCDIYRYVLGARGEEHLTQLSSPTADERQPAIARGKIAFIRRERGGRGTRYDNYDTIRIGDTTTARRPTRVLVKVDISKETLSDPALGFGPKLPAGALAYVLHDPGPYGFARQRVRVLDLGARSSVNAYTATSGGANFANVTHPTWDPFAGLLYFARTNDGSGQGNRFVRWSLATHRLSYAAGDRFAETTAWVAPSAGLFVGDALAQDACRGNANDGPDKSLCKLYTTGPLSFTAKP
ncbi:MAG: hypothetical protein ACXVSX_15150 [Solirubrobacteraceae bacterium]